MQRGIIEQLINIQSGDLYNQKRINAISTRIKETPYLIENRSAEYEFINNKAVLFINASNKKANYINGVIGIQPQNNSQINVTGDANLKFINALKKGETFSLNWRKMYVASQFLETKFKFPFLLKSKFGVFSEFDMFKKDTSFFNLNAMFGTSFSFSEKSKTGLYYKTSKSNILDNSLLNTYKNTTIGSIGFNYELDFLDYKFNPRKGIYSLGDLQFGNKIVYHQNDTTIEKARSINYQFMVNLFGHIPIGSKSTLKISGNFASILNPLLYENELFRIGGNKLLRGFDEETIWASSYLVGSIEYRLILEQNSNLFVFFEQGWYEQKLTESYKRDLPFGFGVGVNFETKPGIFSISYALGSQQKNPVLLKTAKIHFGFINFF